MCSTLSGYVFITCRKEIRVSIHIGSEWMCAKGMFGTFPTSECVDTLISFLHVMETYSESVEHVEGDRRSLAISM